MTLELAHSAVAMLRLDAMDRISTADDAILKLQLAAGGEVDGRIVVPQIVAVAHAEGVDFLMEGPGSCQILFVSKIRQGIGSLFTG